MNALNPEEKNILNSVEQDEWQSVDNISDEISRYQAYANHQINQQKIEVILSIEDAEKIKKLSKQLGQSISNLSREILHKYLQDELIEKRQ